MRKLKLLGYFYSLILLIALSVIPSKAIDVQIGTATTSTTTYPFIGNWGGEKNQFIFTSEEIAANGGITGFLSSLSLNLVSNTATSNSLSGFSVRLQNTSLTTFSAWVNDGWTTAYDGTWELPTTAGWVTIPFQTPFLWDGSSNLLVELCWAIGTTNRGGATDFQYTATTSELFRYQYEDSRTSCAAITGVGMNTVNRPNVLFDLLPATIPYITSTPGLVSFGYVPNNYVSATRTILIGGDNLSPASGDLTITPSGNFEVSIDNGTTWSATPVNIAYVGNPIATPIPVQIRFVPNELQNYTGTIIIAGGSATKTVNLSGTTLLVYCASGATSTYDQDIGNVTIGSGDNILLNNGSATPIYSNAEAIQTYNDYTLTVPPVVLQGGLSYPISVSIVNRGTYAYSAKINVYIDYNANGVFDTPAELAFTVPVTGNGNALTSDTWTGVFEVPPTVNLIGGGLARMRVVVDEYDVASACGTYTYGETEDYTVQFLAPTSYFVATPNNLQFNYAATGTYSVPQTVLIGGDLLEPAQGDMTITPSEGFQVSTDGGTTWSAEALTIPYIGNPIATPISLKVRFSPTATQAYSGTITLTGGTATRVIPVAGTSVLVYCTSYSTSTADDDIGNVTIGSGSNIVLNNGEILPSLNNSTSTNVYTDFTVTVPPVQLQGGSTYPISISQINSGGFYGCALKVYIDYNVNGIFDLPGELAYSTTTVAPTNATTPNTYSGTFTVPYTILSSGSGMSRMRVVLTEGSTANPCGSYSYGETEDYAVHFIPSPPYVATTPSTVSFGVVLPDSVSTVSTIALQAGTLTPESGDITVTPSANFQVSLDGTAWSATPITVAYADGGATLTPSDIKVRFNSPTTLATTFAGTLTFNGANMPTPRIVTLTADNMQTYSASTVSTTSTIDTIDIAKVTIANLAFGEASVTPITGRATANKKYTDNRLDAPRVEMNAGSIYNYTVNTYTTGNAMPLCSLSVYIDYNADGDFDDAGETATTVAIPAANNGVITGTIAIPITANRTAKNNPRMRFVLSTATPSATSTTYTVGETEDYRVKFLDPLPYLAVTPVTKAFGYVRPDTLSATQDLSLTAIALFPTSGDLTVTPTTNFEISTDGGTTWSTTPLSIPYTTTDGVITLTPSVVKSRFHSPAALGLNFTGSVTISGGSATNPAVVAVNGDNMQTYPACTVLTTSTSDTIDIAKITVGSVTFGETNVTPITGRTTAINKFTDNRLAAPVLDLNAGSTYNYTVNTYTTGTVMPLCSLSVFVDYNADGDFADAGESASTVTIPTTNNGVVTGTFTVPTTATLNTINNPRMRFVLSTAAPSATSTTYTTGETEDYRIALHPAVPMVYVSTTAAQVGKSIVGASSVNEKLLQVTVQTNNTGTPLTLNTIEFNTNGTIPTSAIASAKVYSTGATATFATTTMIGTAIATPDGDMTFTPDTPLTLLAGANYLWLAYDVATEAGVDAVLDAELTGLYISDAPGVNKITTPMAPAGVSLVNRLKFDGTFPTTGTTFPINGWTNLGIIGTNSWRIVTAGSYPTSVAHSAPAIAELNSYLITAGNTIALISPSFSMSSSEEPTTFSLWLYRHNYNTSAPGSVLKVFMNTNPNVTGASLLNVVGYENVNEINVRMDQGAIPVPSAGWYQYTYQIPEGFNGATNYLVFEGISDYENNIQLDDVKFGIDAFMAYTGNDTLGTGATSFPRGVNNNLVNAFNVKTLASNNPLSLANVKLTAEGTTNVADVANAKVWYLGSTASFDPETSVLFGTVASITNGEMTVTRTEGANPLVLAEGNNYFAVTFDVSTTATVSNVVDCRVNSFTYARNDATTIVNIPNGNTWGNHIIKLPMGGTYTIGGTQLPTRWYPTLYAAIDEVNNLGMESDVNFAIAGDQVIDPANPPAIYSLIYSGTGNYSLTFYPTTNVNITSAYTGSTAMFSLVASDRVTIDGRINQTGTTSGLTFTNTANGRIFLLNSYTSGPAVNFANIKYVNFVGNDKTNSSNILLQINGAAHSDININHCTFKKGYYGIYEINGNSANKVQNLTIENNTFGDAVTDANSIGFNAINLSYSDNVQCNHNTIQNIVNASSFAAVNIANDVSNSMFSYNKIKKLINNSTNRASGFYVNSLASSNITFANNALSGINSDGTGGITYCPDGFYFNAGGNYKLYNNSVKLEGNRSTVSTNTPSAPSAVVYVESTVTELDFRNNIFVNNLISSVSTLKNYGIYSAAPATAYTTLNYNNYYVSGSAPFIGYLTADQPTFVDWQTITTQDINSTNYKVTFQPDLEMHLSGASACNYNLEAPAISGITTDIDGFDRQGSTKMGVDEVYASVDITEQPPAFIEQCITTGQNNTVNIPVGTLAVTEYSDGIARTLNVSEFQYTWMKNGVAIAATDAPLQVVYTAIPAEGDTYQASIVAPEMALDPTYVSLSEGPTVFTLSGTGTLCPDATVGVDFTLSNSEFDVYYKLMLGTQLIGEPVIGTGEAITFSNVTAIGTYEVYAYRTANIACSTKMAGTATITSSPVATAYGVVGGGTVCSGSTQTVAIGLSSSQVGVTYSILLNNVPTSTTVAGTGSTLSLGTFTTPGTYTVIGTRGTCTTVMTGSAIITTTAAPVAFAVTGGGVGSSVIGLTTSEAGVTYKLYKNTVLIPALTVDGTGSAITFGTFTEAATYTAKATRNTCETEMTGSAVITEAPVGFTLSGTLKYANNAQTVMNNCTVIVKSGTVEVSRTTTNATGNYSITGLANGTYTIEILTIKTAGGLNSLDVASLRKKVANVVTYSPLQLKAGDINNNGSINSLDVAPLRQKIGNLVANNWRVSNFVFYPNSVTINGADATLNIQSLCGGDVNGSFVPGNN